MRQERRERRHTERREERQDIKKREDREYREESGLTKRDTIHRNIYYTLNNVYPDL